MRYFQKAVVFLSVLFLISSCATPKYPITNYGTDVPSALLETNAYLVRPGDKLKVQSFNNLSSVLIENTMGNITANGVPEFEAWVDNDGYISLPKAGIIKVAGLTRKQASDAVNAAYKNILTGSNFNVLISNMRVKIQGAVNTQGLYYLERENQTLSEVLALAGGVRYENMSKKLIIIRSRPDGSEAMQFKISAIQLGDPRLNNIVIRDNDIIYVVPSKASVNSAKFQQYAAYLTPLSVLLNTTALILTLTR